MIFPDRPRPASVRGLAHAVVVAAYVPAVVLGVARVSAVALSPQNPAFVVDRVITFLDRANYAYLAVCVLAGLIGLARARAQVSTITARRQLRWLAWGTALGGAPFVLAYAIPHAFMGNASMTMGLSAIPLSLLPLAYASAIVRYRLLDIEVIVKRSLVYAAALCAIALIYAGLLEGVDRFFRGAAVGRIHWRQNRRGVLTECRR
jgi:hypothetical protein